MDRHCFLWVTVNFRTAWTRWCVTAAMLRYRRGELHRLKRRSRHMRPEPAVLDSLAATGILQRRGRRAGRNTQRPITIVDRTLTKARQGRGRRGAGCNVNNLIRPKLMRHAFRPVSKIVCATLNVRSLRSAQQGRCGGRSGEQWGAGRAGGDGVVARGLVLRVHRSPACARLQRRRGSSTYPTGSGPGLRRLP